MIYIIKYNLMLNSVFNFIYMLKTYLKSHHAIFYFNYLFTEYISVYTFLNNL